ncbi:MAG: AMP-binding protein [Chloroflexi bacterium]|nr:AMP-binding protein [Chloroflexota bacterium]
MAAPAAPEWPIFGRDVPDAPWRPSPRELAESRLAGLVRSSGEPSLDALQAHAAADPGWFWGLAADDIGVAWTRRPRSVLDITRGPEWSRWWIGGAFNYAAACLDVRAERDLDGHALVWEGEDGEVRTFTNAELRHHVHWAAAMLQGLGVEAGDRVGILLPMLPETVISVLALGLLEAIYTPIFSGYGATAIAARLNDCEASLLITADGFRRRGGLVGLKAMADDAVASAPSVKRTLVVRRLGDAAPDTPWSAERDVWWDAALAATSMPSDGLEPPATDPETPYMLIYTSGTTGRPKGAVHVHGGFPIKGARDLAHSFDLGRGDTLFWFTDLGWMMGPWAISGSLLLGARLVLYEGTPDFPGPDRLWSIVERHRITHLGLSPTVIRALMVHGEEPVQAHELSSIRVLGSTGEPWNPEPWWWYFREIGGGRCPVINYSGGTEVSGGIVSGNPLTPLRATSFGGPQVGVAADVVDASGQPVRGEVGELVIRQPLPGMTRGFWRDPDRYVETYWSRFPGVWVHGDWALIDADGYWYIQGRSDDTLKIAGKRVGPAEVESAAVAHPSVVEAAAVGTPHDVKGESIAVFCVLRPGETDSPDLRASISAEVTRELGKALKPELVAVIPALPKTRSGKVMRRVVRAAYLGLDPGDLSALDDPSLLKAISEVAR